MGQVTMDLNELDAIRDQVKTLGLEVEKRNQTISEKDTEIAIIKADKRTVKITETLKKTEKDVSSNFNGWNLNPNYPSLRPNNILDNLRNYIYKSIRSCPSHEIGYMSENIAKYSYDLIKSEYKNNSKYSTETIIEYINFEDVQQEIRAKLEQDVAQEMGKLKSNVSKLTTDLSEITNKHNTEVVKLKEQHDKEYNEVIEKTDKTIKKLHTDYTDLLNDKNQKTLEEQIKELKLENERLKNKKWYQSIDIF